MRDAGDGAAVHEDGSDPACGACGLSSDDLHTGDHNVQRREPIDGPHGTLGGPYLLCEMCAASIAKLEPTDGCLVCGADETSRSFELGAPFGVDDIETYFSGNLCDECASDVLGPVLQLAAAKQGGGRDE